MLLGTLRELGAINAFSPGRTGSAQDSVIFKKLIGGQGEPVQSVNNDHEQGAVMVSAHGLQRGSGNPSGRRRSKLDMKMTTNLEKVGALWQNTSADGQPYFNLDVEGQKYVVFSNGYKEEEKQPDFLVYERVKESKK